MLQRLPIIGIAVLALLGWPGQRLVPAADQGSAADEKLLESVKIGTGTPDLVDFLRKQIVRDDDRKRIEALIVQLGSDKFAARKDAQQQLIASGAPAIPFLKNALSSTDPEVKLRAEECLTKLNEVPGQALTAAAIRLLVERQAPEGVRLFLDLACQSNDVSVEEEILTGLAVLGIREGVLDPRLERALQESDPQRRAAAGCAIGRSGSPAHRATVRRLLGDKDAKVRLYAAHGLLGARFPRSGDDGQTPEDEGLLQKAKVASDAAGLSEFFRKRTLGPDDLQQIKMCIKQLSGDKFKDREDASRKLIEYGPAALDLLRDAARGADLEMVRRSEIIIDTISNHPGPALPMAALRLVARRPTADAVPLLLGYIPFVDDTRVEEEALNALAVVSVREARVDPALVAAVKDAHAARRAAAGWVLGRVGEKDHCTLVQALLKDPDVRARLRTSQGLLAARDRTAVDPLIDVLRDGNAEQAAEAEAVLQQLAGEDSPPVYIGEGSAEARRKSQDAWLAWWRDQGSKQELPNLELSNRQLGLTLVAELTGNNANGNRIWEFGLDGKLRWELANLQGPIDAHMLPHGRVLIAEHNGQRVTERDLKGDVKWEHKIQGNPVACQRLANGNTFIATYNMVMEVTPDNRVLYQHNPNAGGVIYDASKLANGNIVCIGGRGTIIEMDTSGKQVKATQVQNNGGWAGVTPLPGGRYLVAMMNPGKVVEVDREGKIGWQCNVQYACHAVRLPNGNTLVACMNSQRVVEVNRNGEKVWERQTTGRPFHVRRR